jgi:hypothetical protein
VPRYFDEFFFVGVEALSGSTRCVFVEEEFVEDRVSEKRAFDGYFPDGETLIIERNVGIDRVIDDRMEQKVSERVFIYVGRFKGKIPEVPHASNIFPIAAPGDQHADDLWLVDDEKSEEARFDIFGQRVRRDVIKDQFENVSRAIVIREEDGEHGWDRWRGAAAHEETDIPDVHGRARWEMI